MAYEQYMVEEDLDIERSLRDTRLGPQLEGVSDISANRAAGVFGGIPTGGLQVQEMLAKAAKLNEVSRGIRKDHSVERNAIAGNQMLNDLTGTLEATEGMTGVGRAEAIQKFMQENPQATQYKSVRDFMVSEKMTSEMPLRVMEIESREAAARVRQENQDLINETQANAYESALKASQDALLDNSTKDAQIKASKLKFAGQHLGMMDLPPESKSAAFSIFREFENDPEQQDLINALGDSITSHKVFSDAESSWRTELSSISTSSRRALNKPISIPKLDEEGNPQLDESGEPVFDQVSVLDLDLSTPEGNKAYKSFMTQVQKDMGGESGAATLEYSKFNEVLQEAMQSKSYAKETQDSFAEIAGKIAGYKKRIKEGDPAAKEEMMDAIYEHNFIVDGISSKASQVITAQLARQQRIKDDIEMRKDQAGIDNVLSLIESREEGDTLAHESLQFRKFVAMQLEKGKTKYAIIDLLQEQAKGNGVSQADIDKFKKSLNSLNEEFDLKGIDMLEDSDSISTPSSDGSGERPSGSREMF